MRSATSVLVVALAAGIVGQLCVRNQHVDRAPLPDPVNLLRGANLYPLRLWRLSLNTGAGNEASGPNTLAIADLFENGCGVVVFFLSTCPGCRSMAPAWEGVEKVRLGLDSVPVAWIGLHADTSAATFAGEYGLAGDFYYAENTGAWIALGIRRTPTVYLIDRGRFVGELPLDPRQVAETGVTCAQLPAP